MIDKVALLQRAIAWENAHPPNTGYTKKAFENVLNGNLPNGANLWTQIAAQFTGKEEAVDLVHWDKPEDQIEYSNSYRWSLDRSTDCSSTWCIFYRIFFNIDIGTWTEAQYTKLTPKKITWANRRVADHVLYNFKASEGRHASHASNIVLNPDPTTKVGMIGHTRSPANPFMFDPDTYSAAYRIGVYRVLTDAQYQSLIVTDHKAGIVIPKWPTLFWGVVAPVAVKEYKSKMLLIYPRCGLTVANTSYLDECVKVTKTFQADTTHRDELGAVLKIDGEVGPKTKYALAVALSKL